MEQREHVSLTEHGVEGILLVKVITVIIGLQQQYTDLSVKYTGDGSSPAGQWNGAYPTCSILQAKLFHPSQYQEN